MAPPKIGTLSALFVGCFVLITLLMFGGYTAYNQSIFAAKRLVKDVVNLAEDTASATAVQFLIEDYSVLESVLGKLAKRDSVSVAVATDMKGKPLAMVERNVNGKAELSYKRDYWQLPTAAKQSLHKYADYYEIFQPVMVGSSDEPEQLGWIILQVSNAEIKQILNTIIVDTGIGATVIFIICVLSINTVMRKPAGALSSAAKFASSLDEYHGNKMEVCTFSAEFKELCESLNEASGRLLAQDESIQLFMSEIKSKNLMLKDAREATALVSAAKTNFMHNISHELRTPVNGIAGCLQLLMTMELNGNQLQYAQVAFDSTNKLTETINKVLDFSNLEVDVENVIHGKVMPSKIVETTVFKFQSIKENDNVQLQYNISSSVPSIILSDGKKIEKILNIFVENAIQYTKQGTIILKLDVATDSASSEQYIKYTVSDTGDGIDDSFKNKLFTPFQQGDGGLTRAHGGTGIGLAIVKRLVDMIGGKVGYTSEFGVGSQFWFTVPIAVDSASINVEKSGVYPNHDNDTEAA